MSILAEIISWIMLLTGGFLVLVGGIGALRMPDFFTRIHAASLTDSAGSILILVGIMLQAGLSLAAVKLAAILLFLLITAQPPHTRWLTQHLSRASDLSPQSDLRSAHRNQKADGHRFWAISAHIAGADRIGNRAYPEPVRSRDVDGYFQSAYGG